MIQELLHNQNDFKDATKLALTVVAGLKRQGMGTLLIPAALNDYGFRTDTGEMFTMKLFKALLRGEIGAKR